MAFETIEITDNSPSGGQSIRIPADFKINDNKVYLKKVGNLLYLIPFHNPWDSLVASLEGFTPDFMADRQQPDTQKRESFE